MLNWYWILLFAFIGNSDGQGEFDDGIYRVAHQDL
jgi:hypothetical protein